jgi:hypothetical protein
MYGKGIQSEQTLRYDWMVFFFTLWIECHSRIFYTNSILFKRIHLIEILYNCLESNSIQGVDFL